MGNFITTPQYPSKTATHTPASTRTGNARYSRLAPV